MRRWLGLHVAVVIALLYAPILVLALFSFNAAEQVVVWRGFTFEWYRRALGNAAVRAAFADSMAIGLGATLLASLLGTAAGFALARRRSGALAALVALPMGLPDVLMGLSLSALFLAAGAELGRATVIAAHATFCLGYVALVVAARARALDPDLPAAARDLGAGPLRAFASVTWPAVAPAVAAGALLAFAVSFDDVVVSAFTSGPRVETLPVYLYSKVRFRHTPEVNALSVMALAGSALLVAGALAFQPPRPPEERR